MLASALQVPKAHPLVQGLLNGSGSKSGSGPDLIPSASDKIPISKNKKKLWLFEFKLQ